MASHNSLNIVGQTFGELVVIQKSETKIQKTRWKCRCSCGKEKTFFGSQLTRGLVKSCGCLTKRKHQAARERMLSVSREYRIWQAMLNRCRNKNVVNYQDYGGRGISVCDRWHSFDNFFLDMGPCGKEMSIDRIDTNGNYEPGNCRWATRAQQARNTRRNRILELNGVSKCLVEWASDLGIDQASLRERLEKWPLEIALTKKRVER